jgi:adenylylsulfate kinase
MAAHGDFIEIYCDSSIEICEQRDVKGMYKKARAGQIKEFTGVSAPYEAPTKPELSINTALLSVDDCVTQVMAEIKQRRILQE